MPPTPDQLPVPLLKAVSRSFYFTLRVLPVQIRPQIGLAYLLARTTDTIADTELVALDQRLQALQALRDRIQGRSTAPLEFNFLAQKQASPAERILLQQSEASLAAFQNLSPADRSLVAEVLDTITSGQELDLRRFSGASASHIIALQTDADLDDYTYRVAGCVGEFWTKMCLSHLFTFSSSPSAPDEASLLASGVRFGKGLQLVNILRDLPADLRQGRCYLPQDALAASGLKPADLLQPASEAALRPLYDSHLDRAEAHLSAGWAYTLALPRTFARLRLACAWPILIGFRTLKLLRAKPILSSPRLKLSHSQVYLLILNSILLHPFPRLWAGLAPRHQGAPS